ncbi:hypothetical protein F511_00351 [Dorcoceras hygrometricum]|nr:hypothetical protein F511_00351 [Dorcoceras hygrometricum]
METLFVQIFERKNRIIEQVKQQTELYSQDLASKLIIEGITPPSWLWNPAGSSDSKELNKEELISKLLGPYTVASVPCCTERYLYDKPFISGANQELSDGFVRETLDHCPNGQGSPTVSATRGEAVAGCSQNRVPEIDLSITSPKDQTTNGLLDISNAPDQSLARIQRSKSRQKALELRNSANTVAESALDNENIGAILSRRIRLSTISSSKQKDDEIEPPELGEPCAFGSSSCKDLGLDKAGCQNKDNGMDLYSARNTSSTRPVKVIGSGRTSLELGHYQNERKDLSSHDANTSKRSSVCTSNQEVADYHDRLLQSSKFSAAFGQNDGDIRLDRAGSLSKEKRDAYSDSFSNDAQRMVSTIVDFGEDLQKDHIDGSPIENNICNVGHVDRDSRGSILEGGKSYKESSSISEPVQCSEIPYCSTLSRSSPRKKSAANDKVQIFSGCRTSPPWCDTKDMPNELGNVDFMMNSKLVAHNLNHTVGSNANGDEPTRVSLSSNSSKQRRQLESLGAKDSIDRFVSEEIKQLDFSVTEEQNPQTISSSLGKNRPDNSPENVLEHELIPNDDIPNCAYNSSLGEHSPEELEVQKSVAKAHAKSSESDILEHLDICTEKYDSFTSENTIPKRPRDNIEGVSHQYSEVEDDADIMMSKMVDTPTLQFHPYKQCWEQEHETTAEQAIEKGNWSGEGSAKSTEFLHATGSKDVGQSCIPKLADNPREESRSFSSGQMEMANPMCAALDKIEQFPVQESQISSHLTGESQDVDTHVEDNWSINNHVGDLLLEGRSKLVSIGSWPQLKRRKIEELQMNRLTSYPISVKNVGSIQRDSPSRYLRNIEMDVSTDLTDSLDRKMSINKEMDQEKDTDDINMENLTHTTRMLQEEKSPQFLDGQQSQCWVFPPKSEDLKFVAESMPVFERFNVETEADNSDLDFTADGIDMTELSLSRIAIERASIIEEICRSASLDTPISHIQSALNCQGTVNPFQSLPNGLLEHLDLKTSLPLNVSVNKQLDSGKSLVNDAGDALERIERVPYAVSLPYSGARYGWTSRIRNASPVGSFWERLSSHTGSSEKCSISNPELTCFPIEEDPCTSEDNKRDELLDDFEEETNSLFANCNLRHPLKDLTNMGLNPAVSNFAQQDILREDTVDVMSAQANDGGTPDDDQWSPKIQSRYYSEMGENQSSSLGNTERKSYQTLPIGYDGIKKAKVSIDESVNKPNLSSKTSLKKQEQNVSLKDSKRNNIVSNICSFIPLVQQTQAAAVCGGKREIKVKALEAAEAAKRLQEKKMNERKNRKEALKLERAKLEVENLRKMELEKKRKELERKKKDADTTAKKRLREEEERMEKEKKRMRLEARLRQREQEERGRATKSEKEKQHTKVDEQINSKKSYNEVKKEQNRGAMRGDGIASKKAVNEECGTSGDSFEAEKALSTVESSPKNEDLIVQKELEKSYEISPYQCSDDEDEEDDELPTKKCIPSWASKRYVGLQLPLQQKMKPDLIFRPESFCSMDEVLLPRKLQQRQMDA